MRPINPNMPTLNTSALVAQRNAETKAAMANPKGAIAVRTPLPPPSKITVPPKVTVPPSKITVPPPRGMPAMPPRGMPPSSGLAGMVGMGGVAGMPGKPGTAAPNPGLMGGAPAPQSSFSMMKKGGKVSSASSRGDGIATKGKTKGKLV
jgi:hypothetical protein